MKSKTIILSSNKKFDSNSPRAILTLICENNQVDGKIRLYNLNSLNKYTKLGIYHNNEVIASTLSKDRDSYNFKLNKKLDFDKELYCALIDTSNKNEVILSGGNDMEFCFSDEEDCNTSEESFSCDDCCDSKNYECKNCVYKQYFYSHQENDKNTTQDCLTNSQQPNYCCNDCIENNCENNNLYQPYQNNKPDFKNNFDCTHDKFPPHNFKNLTDLVSHQDFDSSDEFKSQKPEPRKFDNFDDSYTNLFDDECLDYDSFEIIQEQNATEINCEQNNPQKLNCNKQENDMQNCQNEESKNINQSKSEDVKRFIETISEQLDELFLTYPIDQEIVNIIPNSKVVTVTDIMDKSTYVVGVIYEDNTIRYLLYGVPSKYNSPPPAELGDNYQWLATNPDDPMSDGYYLIYQDASDGKLVPIHFQ